MRVKLGIIAPFAIQLGIIFLYSSIRYETLQTSLIPTVIVLILPILVVYVLAPHLLSLMVGLKNHISDKISDELDKFLLSDKYGQEEGRTQMLEFTIPFSDNIQTISTSIKQKLVPLLTDRAIDHYKDNFFSRDYKLSQHKSFEYFEALILFSGLSVIFFLVDMIMVWVMSYTTISIYFIKLDLIETPAITLNLTILFILGVIQSYLIFEYSERRMLTYLPYLVPIQFNEPVDEQYLRRETIRSLAGYNFDNLIDRKDQKTIYKNIENVMEDLLQPLLREEILITARTEFAHKLAWREYSKLISKNILNRDPSEQSYIELLAIGEKIGPIQLEEKDLLGIHSDVQYINNHINKWETIPDESRLFVYFQLYRVVEFLIKEFSESLDLFKNEEEFNLYAAINALADMDYISSEGRSHLHNLRYRRNKLMHEPGITLDVSLDGIESVMETIEVILEKVDLEYK